MMIPNKASNTVGFLKFPSATNVDSLATMIPAFFKPTNATKKPIPAPIASFNCAGIALIIIRRMFVTVMMTKMIPDTNTQASAPSGDNPICPTIV